MARTPRSKDGTKPPRLARVARRVAGLETPQKPAALPMRKKGKDIRTPSRWRVAAAYLELATESGGLPHGGMKKLNARFPGMNLTARTVQRIVKQYREQAESVETSDQIDMSRKRAERTGGHMMKLTEELAQCLIETNDKNWGKLSNKRLDGKLSEQGYPCSTSSVRRWCKVLGAVRRRRYIRPKLTLRHKYNRLKWVIDEDDERKRKFGDNNNTCHGDEKWFYIMRDGAVCRVFPKYTKHPDGHVESEVRMPVDAKLYHKTRMPKVMFLAVTARPHAEYNFDGKLGIWPFTLTRMAQRSDKRTGTVAGVTEIVQTVTVTADEYRRVMLMKDGVFDAIREKMWWFSRASGKPESGKIIWYQHDGARPHTAAKNEKQWSLHGKRKGFDIRVVTQPAQSPDLNVNDLAFFASLQSDTELVAKEKVTDLVEAVTDCWHAYPLEKMESVWRCLYASFKGIVETGGDNQYSHHTGSRAKHSESDRAGERHDRSLPLTKIRAAQKLCLEMEAKLQDQAVPLESSSAASSDDDE